MTKGKKRLIIFGSILGGIIITAIVATFFIVAFSALTPWGFDIFSDNPPKSVDSAEFPFKVVYEYNGKEITIEDTLVIEHDGVDWNSGIGKYNVWDYYFKNKVNRKKHKNSPDSSLILAEVEKGKYIYLYLGNCEYYLEEDDNLSYPSLYDRIIPGEAFTVTDTSNLSGFKNFSKNELYAEYGIRIIDVELSLPLSE